MTHEFKPAEFHATCCWDKILSPATERFRKKRGCHKRKTVAATCPCDMPPSVCRPFPFSATKHTSPISCPYVPVFTFPTSSPRVPHTPISRLPAIPTPCPRPHVPVPLSATAMRKMSFNGFYIWLFFFFAVLGIFTLSD